MVDFDRIIFYNFYHNGDIFVSKGLVNFIINNIQAKEYYYFHCNSSKLIQDIPKIKHIKKLPSNDLEYSGWRIDENTLWCNTWYNSFNKQEFEGCTIQTLFKVFKRGLKEVINFDLPGEPLDYLPDINFDFFNVDYLFNMILPLRKIILIDNCNVLSGQSHNFDFNPVIDHISNQFSDIVFLVTNKNGDDIIKKNVTYCSDVIDERENNLNEISYLSGFCDILIGRNSGPHTFCFRKDNLGNRDKTFVCISHENFGIVGMVNADFVCSQDYSIEGVINVIEETIRRKML
jgi:hypothetical protein